MRNLNSPSIRKPARIVAVLTTIGGCCCLAPLAYVLRGCMIEHSRHENGDFTFDISPDGRTLVLAGVGEGGRDLYLFDLITRKVTPLTSSGSYDICPTFSPDGKRVAFTRGVPGVRADQLCVIDLATREVVQLTDSDENVSSPSFLPDGKSILCTVETQYRWGGLSSSWFEGGRLREIHIESKRQTLLKAPTFPVFGPRVSRDGKWMVWYGDGASIASSNHPEKARVIADQGSFPATNADGNRLAISIGNYAPDHQIFVTNRSGGARRPMSNSKGSFFSVFSPDGRDLYFLNECGEQGLKMADVATGKSVSVASMQLFESPRTFRE